MIFPPFYSWGNYSLEWLSNWTKATQVMSDGVWDILIKMLSLMDSMIYSDRNIAIELNVLMCARVHSQKHEFSSKTCLHWMNNKSHLSMNCSILLFKLNLYDLPFEVWGLLKL